MHLSLLRRRFPWDSDHGRVPIIRIALPVRLFPRIATKKKSSTEEEGKTAAPPKPAAQRARVDIDTFGQVELRTAKVLEAESVPKSRKLVKLQIEIGDDRRQIVAGIAEHYSPEQLVGKTIVVVATLEPATVFGVDSDGMLLAAKAGKSLRLITVDGDIASGAKVS